MIGFIDCEERGLHAIFAEELIDRVMLCHLSRIDIVTSILSQGPLELKLICCQRLSHTFDLAVDCNFEGFRLLCLWRSNCIEGFVIFILKLYWKLF